ncbi:MAG: glycosyltransferase [Gemmataceae bacterium]
MSLSVCVLAYNAKEKVERIIRSVAPLNAEVVVGDTGSYDGTHAAVQALGATVVPLEWKQDFGAAQNDTVARAQGDWVLWINPGEELTAEHLDAVPGLLGRTDVLAYAVRMEHVARADRPDRVSVTWYPRLFRRLPEVQFAGRVHPQFSPPLEDLAARTGRSLSPCPLCIRHYAYESTLTPAKLRWGTRLLALELQDRPGQLHYLIEYGRNLLLLNDPQGHTVLAEAADVMLQSLDTPRPPTATASSLIEYLLTVSPEQSKSRVTPGQAAVLARRWFPDSPPLLWLLAQRAFQAGQYRDAAGLLERLLFLAQTESYDQSAGFDPSILGEPTVLNLATCYFHLGELDRAEPLFTRLLADPTHQAKAQLGLNLIRARREGRSTDQK